MLDIILSNQFKKDLKLASKRGYKLDLLDAVVARLAAGESLPEKNRDHELILFLSRTGTHSDLF